MEFNAKKARERAEASSGRMKQFIEKAEVVIAAAADQGKFDAWVEIPGSTAPGNSPGERMNEEFKSILTAAGYKCQHYNGNTLLIEF